MKDMFVVLVRFQEDIIKVVILLFDERAVLVIESSKTRVNMTIQKHNCRGDGCGSHITCALAAAFRLALPLPAQAQPAQAQQARAQRLPPLPNMSLLDFLRKSGNNGQISQRYRRMHSHSKIGMPLNDWINVHPPDGKTLVANLMYAHTNDRQ